MIDNRFSAEAFETAGFGSESGRELAKELQVAIQNELDQAIQPAVLEIINKLNRLGHKLNPVGEQVPGEKHYREYGLNDLVNYKFLVAVDVVVSVGYPNTTDREM